jgi:SAM-dependent methyltransferase
MIGDPSANRELFTGKAGDYSCARPNYPAALYEHLCEICAPAADAAVADVGAGTGLLTEGLLKAGYRVVAIEPNGDMRAVADRLADVYPAYQGVAGSAESLPLPDSSVDLVTAAQAFHWFHPENARAEFLRVLKPDGMVALIWNDRLPGDALNQALDELFREYRGMKSAALAAREERWGTSGSTLGSALASSISTNASSSPSGRSMASLTTRSDEFSIPDPSQNYDPDQGAGFTAPAPEA